MLYGREPVAENEARQPPTRLKSLDHLNKLRNPHPASWAHRKKLRSREGRIAYEEVCLIESRIVRE